MNIAEHKPVIQVRNKAQSLGALPSIDVMQDAPSNFDSMMSQMQNSRTIDSRSGSRMHTQMGGTVAATLSSLRNSDQQLVIDDNGPRSMALKTPGGHMSSRVSI